MTRNHKLQVEPNRRPKQLLQIILSLSGAHLLEFTVITTFISTFVFSVWHYDWTLPVNILILPLVLGGCIAGISTQMFRGKVTLYPLKVPYSLTTLFWIVSCTCYIIHIINNPVSYWDNGSEWSLHIIPDRGSIAAIALPLLILFILLHSDRLNRQHDIEIGIMLPLFFLVSPYQSLMVDWSYDAFLLYPIILVAALQLSFLKKPAEVLLFTRVQTLSMLSLITYLGVAGIATILATNRYGSTLQLLKLTNSFLLCLIIVKGLGQASIPILLKSLVARSLFFSALLFYKFGLIWWHIDLQAALKYRYIISGGTHTFLAKDTIQAILICAAFLVITRRRKWLLYIVLLLPIIILTYSMAALTAIAVASLIWVLLVVKFTNLISYLSQDKRRYSAIIGSIGLLTILAIMFSPQIIKIVFYSDSGLSRVLLWERNFNVVYHHPWFGLGMSQNSYDYWVHAQYLPEFDSVYAMGLNDPSYILRLREELASHNSSHNTFADIATQTGLLGLALVLLGLLAASIFSFNVYRQLSDRSVKVMLATVFCCMLMIIIHNQVQPEYQWTTIPFEVLFYFGLLNITSDVSSSIIAGKPRTKQSLIPVVWYSLLVSAVLLFSHSIIVFAYYNSSRRSNDFAEKVQTLEWVTRVMPGNPLAYTDLARLYWRKVNEKFDPFQAAQVIYNYNQAIHISPYDSRYHYSLGYFYCSIKLNSECQSELQHAIKYGPYVARHYLALGDSYLLDNNLDEAINNFTLAAKLDPASLYIQNPAIISLELKQVQVIADMVIRKLEQEARPLTETDPYQAAARLITVAELYVLQLDRHKAIEFYDQVKKIVPEEAYAFQRSGEIYLSLQEYKSAQTELEEALRLKETPDSYYYLGLAYKGLGYLDEAIQSIKKAQDRFVWLRFQNSYYVLSSIYETQGNTQEAIQTLKADLFLHETKESRLALARLYGMKDEKEEVINLYQEAAKINPNAAWHHIELGKFYLEQAMSDQ